jgi:methylmalonyl-CoA carboxyltransferase 1.3S subunit
VKIQIAIGGKAYEVEIEREGEEYAAGELPREAPIQSQRVPTASRREPSSETDATDSRVCRSPVAGIVTRVAVQPGDSFRVDELIVVLEAMKMETSVTAPIAGRVKSVKVVPRQAVKLNQVLVEFEELPIQG